MRMSDQSALFQRRPSCPSSRSGMGIPSFWPSRRHALSTSAVVIRFVSIFSQDARGSEGALGRLGYQGMLGTLGTSGAIGEIGKLENLGTVRGLGGMGILEALEPQGRQERDPAPAAKAVKQKRETATPPQRFGSHRVEGRRFLPGTA